MSLPTIPEEAAVDSVVSQPDHSSTGQADLASPTSAAASTGDESEQEVVVDFTFDCGLSAFASSPAQSEDGSSLGGGLSPRLSGLPGGGLAGSRNDSSESLRFFDGRPLLPERAEEPFPSTPSAEPAHRRASSHPTMPSRVVTAPVLPPARSSSTASPRFGPFRDLLVPEESEPVASGSPSPPPPPPPHYFVYAHGVQGFRARPGGPVTVTGGQSAQVYPAAWTMDMLAFQFPAPAQGAALAAAAGPVTTPLPAAAAPETPAIGPHVPGTHGTFGPGHGPQATAAVVTVVLPPGAGFAEPGLAPLHRNDSGVDLSQM